MHSGNTGEKATNEKRAVALWSVLAAVLLTGTKLLIGIWTGSLGILAEAAHSGLDLVAAVITYGAVRVSDKPPDSSHTYGHGKVENLSALAETFLLLVTCAWIIYEAANRLFVKTVHIDANAWAFAVMAMSIIVDVNRSRVLKRVAEEYDSQALEADALHFSTDVWSSAVVIGGLAIVKLNEWLGGPPGVAQADAVAALVGAHRAPRQLFEAGAGDAAVRRLARRVGRIDRLVRVARADRAGHTSLEAGPFPAGDWLLERARALEVEA